MARAKAAKQEPPEPEDEVLGTGGPGLEAEETEDYEEGEEAGAGGVRPMSKADAARAAIRSGIESPQEASAYIREHFGIDMAPQHFSAVKSQLRKKEREAEPAAQRAATGRRGRAPALENYLAPPPRQPSSAFEPDLLDAMEAIKPLVATLGADKVKRIVELLG